MMPITLQERQYWIRTFDWCFLALQRLESMIMLIFHDVIKMNMAKTFRVAFTLIENSILYIPLCRVDVKKFIYGQPIEDKEFDMPDQNGDKFLIQAWRRECLRLNAQYPHLHHWIDIEQPDSDGVYYQGLPGQHMASVSIPT